MCERNEGGQTTWYGPLDTGETGSQASTIVWKPVACVLKAFSKQLKGGYFLHSFLIVSVSTT